jgi:hypothetical protein
LIKGIINQSGKLDSSMALRMQLAEMQEKLSIALCTNKDYEKSLEWALKTRQMVFEVSKCQDNEKINFQDFKERVLKWIGDLVIKSFDEDSSIEFDQVCLNFDLIIADFMKEKLEIALEAYNDLFELKKERLEAEHESWEFSLKIICQIIKIGILLGNQNQRPLLRLVFKNLENYSGKAGNDFSRQSKAKDQLIKMAISKKTPKEILYNIMAKAEDVTDLLNAKEELMVMADILKYLE